jgi:ribosomal RNA-processing protein 1
MSLSLLDSDLVAVAAPPPTAASIAKLLASPETSVRNRGLRLLASLLPALSPLPVSLLLKIWKGLFFCFWHADKSLYQSSLASSIASLISSNAPDVASQFLDASLLTLRREWANIDHLRMDKFYLLVRRILNHSFQLLQSNSWNSSLLSRVMEIVEERALGPEGTKGFSYHVVEIFLEELVRFLPVTKATLHVLLLPFLRILENSADPILVNKVRADVFTKFLVNGGKYLGLKEESGEIEKGSEIEKFGIIGLIMDFSKILLDLAKKEETVQANKKVLHQLRDGFFKLEKDLEKCGIEISLPEMEIPNEAMKIENGEGSGDQLPNKRKREKVLVETKEKKNKGKKNKKKKKMKTKENTEELPVRGNNIEPEESTDSGTKEDKENERGNENMITFDENVISNLQKQFEKAAAEAGMSAESKYETDTGLENENSFETTPVNPPKITKKRKQAKSSNKMEMSSEMELCGEDVNTGTNGENISSSVKKVRFSMKNNLVWKPSNPMPPHSLRLPPSATPKGSALKKGVPPGPVRDISSPVAMKRRKPKAKSAKMVLLKGSKSPSMAVKRLRKLQSLSA